MTRQMEKLKCDRYRVTEETGEVWYTEIERGVPDEGYRLHHYVAMPILTPQQIADTVLPHFDLESYTAYPQESDTLFSFLCLSHNLYARSILERVARIRITEYLKTISTNEVK